MNNTGIDWKQKLTSRKMWAAIASFVTMVMVYCGAEQGSADQVAAIIIAGATMISYIIGEGMVDYGRSGYIDTSTDGNYEDVQEHEKQ